MPVPFRFIAPGAVVLGDVSLGHDVSIWYNCVIRGDTERISIGDGTNIQDLSMVHADPGFPCTVGARVTVGHRAILHGCTVGDDCLIGMGAILLNGVSIGPGCVIGAGAVLVEGTVISPDSVVLGIPGKRVRDVDSLLRERIEHGSSHYAAMARRHASGEFSPVTGHH